jgi:hypothetical protein
VLGRHMFDWNLLQDGVASTNSMASRIEHGQDFFIVLVPEAGRYDRQDRVALALLVEGKLQVEVTYLSGSWSMRS